MFAFGAPSPLPVQTSFEYLPQTDGIENCRKIELHPEALAMEEIDIMGNYYKKSHVVDKDDQTMYGYEASISRRVVQLDLTPEKLIVDRSFSLFTIKIIT